jgi:hypothetical protein
MHGLGIFHVVREAVIGYLNDLLVPNIVGFLSLASQRKLYIS